MKGFGFHPVFIALLVLASCSSPGWQPSQSTTRSSAASEENFRPISNEARAFVFALYNGSDNRSFFGTGAHNASREARQTPTYKVKVGGHDVATFSESQYIEMDLPPGQYSLEVEELGWLGTSLRRAAAPVSIANPGQVVFIALPTSATDMAVRIVDAGYGVESIDGREKATTAHL
jgi:hypothetical protein